MTHRTPACVGTKESCKIREAQADRTERRIKRIYKLLLRTSILLSQQLIKHLDGKSAATSSTNEDRIDIYRILHSRTAEYILFSKVHGIHTKIGHILSRK